MKRWWLWLVALAVLILGVVFVPALRNLLRSPSDMVDAVSTGMEIKRLEAMIGGFKKETGRWPTEEEFQDLVDKHFKSDRLDNLRSEGLVDMWGEPYTYMRHESGYMMISTGPDRTPHTQDDVILLRRK